MTRSPALYRVTSEPTSVTVLTTSCPSQKRLRPGKADGATEGSARTNNKDKSEAQIPQHWFFTRTQLGPGSGGSGKLVTRADDNGVQTKSGQRGVSTFVSRTRGMCLST